MRRKITIEFIHSEFAKENYTLLTTEYENNTQKLDYICPNGYKHQITWGHWDTSKARCPCHACSGKFKYTLKQAAQKFREVGYTLLADKYINVKTKMKCRCNREHLIYMSLYAIMHKHKCQICARNKRLVIEFVRQEFKKEGYTLLSTNYKNNKQKLKCRCNLGHIHYIRFDSWSNGRRCPICKKIKLSVNRSGKKHWNWKGGISCEPYCQEWTRKYREYIKERDSYKCMNPYCTSKRPDQLSIHHIDYNKKNCGPENLITVCRSCNAKANFNRDWHTSWYQAILNKRYGYIYNKKTKNNKSEVNYVRNK